MDPITRAIASAAAGASAAADPTYVDDVFSTFLYEGNNGNQSINNGIDISGEGGLVWVKNRDSATSHVLAGPDLVSAGYTNLASDLSNAAGTETNYVTSFSSNGFTVGNSGSVNDSSDEYVSWTFRKAPGFFDVVTYTGNGGTQNVSHSLGSVPGMIIYRRIDSTNFWYVYHRDLGNQDTIVLNASDDKGGTSLFNNTTPTSSVFTVASELSTNNGTYVAYLFAHDDQSFGTNSNEAIIKCGSYTGTGSSGNHVNVGFEPQFLLIKNQSRSSTNWMVLDVMRGLPATSGSTTRAIYANTSGAEAANNSVEPSPTGFTPTAAGTYTNASGDTFVYMAIRRPHKPPTAATEVFDVSVYADGSTSIGFVPDTNISKYPDGTQNWFWNARLLGNKVLSSNNTSSEGTTLSFVWDQPTNTLSGGSYNGFYANYVFRRAPGFFDVVTYAGTGSARTVDHNLGAVPELMIVKVRNFTYNWFVYAAPQGNSKYGLLSQTYGNRAFDTDGTIWNSTTPTSTQFSVGTAGGVNSSSYNYVSYLFASLDGISKIGTYSGTGNNVNVDCGFTAGARFVLIKRTDSTGDWYVYDTARGIVSGNDPYLLINSNAQAVTSTDYIDPLNAGFTVTSSAPAALNTSGGTYIFLAIA
jgi:hypothetical protein